MVTNIIIARFGGALSTRTASRYQYDYGQVLKFADLDLPDVYEVHFSNREFFGDSIKQLGNADGVPIPDEFFWNAGARAIYAWVYLHHTDDDGETVYKVTIPLALRSRPSDVEPTPVQQDVIEQAIAALNGAVDATAASAAEAAESATEAETARQAAEAAAETAEAAKTAAEGAQAAAEQSAGAAASSAEAAGRSSTDAETAAGQAEDAAGRAETAAQTVESRVSDAETAATQAAGSATTASGAASQAAQKAGEASTYATNAGASASQAQTYASNASDSATAAAGYAGAASGSATAAERSATEAASSAEAAHTSETNAAASADAAEQSADNASGYAIAAAESAEDAEAAVQTIKTTTAAIIIDSASGAVVSVPDGADDLPMHSVKVMIEPVQDLHGQDAPYPPGGGKNLVSDIVSDYTKPRDYWIWHRPLSDGIYYVTATKKTDAETGFVFLIAKSGDSYTEFVDAISFVTTAGNIYNRSITVDSTWTDPVIGIYCPGGKTLADFFANYSVQLKLGTTDIDYTPYSNICPISGWDEVVTHRTGVNVWDEEWEVGGFYYSNGSPDASTDRIRSKNFIPVRPSTTYYANVPQNARVLFYGIDESFIGVWGDTSWLTARAFDTPADCYYIKFGMAAAYGTTYNHDISINYPSTDTDYHPYHGSTYTTDLPVTVYGGTLDVVSGELTVDMAMVDLGTRSWSALGGRGVFATVINDIYKRERNTPNNAICSAFVGQNEWLASNLTNGGFMIRGDTKTVYFRNNAYTDAGAFAESVSNVIFVYALENPQTYHLTPQEVRTLLGSNNVWSEAGSVSVIYPCDTKLYILKVVGG